jgi:hypothetical protein
MTDHPTRRWPDDDRPAPTDHPTRRLPEHDLPASPAAPNRCLRCEGPMQRFPTASGESDAWPLRVWNPQHVKSTWRGTHATAQVGAWVCLECGYTEFYTEQPRRLLGDR